MGRIALMLVMQRPSQSTAPIMLMVAMPQPSQWKSPALVSRVNLKKNQ
jgi:hypothetical protein